MLAAACSVICYTNHTNSFLLDYELTSPEPLGKGTRGVARLVWSKEGDRDLLYVAKIYEPKTFRDLKEVDWALSRELPAQSKLNSTFIPKVHRFYDEEESTMPRFVIIMDYAGPVTLDKIWKKIAVEVQFDNNKLLLKFITANLIKIVLDLHSQKVAHGDLFMYNVVISADGYLNVIDFDKATIDPPAWVMNYDIQQVCRIVNRLYSVNPSSFLLPTVAEISRRFSRRSKPGSVEEFLSLCTKPEPLQVLMNHPYLRDIDLAVLEQRKLKSPVRPSLLK